MHQLCFDFAVPRHRCPIDTACVRCGKVGGHWTADCTKCRAKRLARPGGATRAPVPVLQRVPCSSCNVMGWWRNGDQCGYCRRAAARLTQGRLTHATQTDRH